MPMEHRVTPWLLTVLVQFFLPRYAFLRPPHGFLVRLFPLPVRCKTRPLFLILVFRGSSLCFHSSPTSPLLTSPRRFFLLYFSILPEACKISRRDCQHVDFLFSRTVCVYHRVT